jgi:hypothetical protein
LSLPNAAGVPVSGCKCRAWSQQVLAHRPAPKSQAGGRLSLTRDDRKSLKTSVNVGTPSSTCQGSKGATEGTPRKGFPFCQGFWRRSTTAKASLDLGRMTDCTGYVICCSCQCVVFQGLSCWEDGLWCLSRCRLGKKPPRVGGADCGFKPFNFCGLES